MLLRVTGRNETIIGASGTQWCRFLPAVIPWPVAGIRYLSGASARSLPYFVDRRAGIRARHLDADCRAEPAGAADHRKLSAGAGDGVPGAGFRVLHFRSHWRDVRGPARQTAPAVSNANAAHVVGVHAGGAHGDGHHPIVDGDRAGLHFRRAFELRSAGARFVAASAGAAGRPCQRNFSSDAGIQCGFHRGSAAGGRGGGGCWSGGRFRFERMQLSGGDRLAFIAADGSRPPRMRDHPGLREPGPLCEKCWR